MALFCAGAIGFVIARSAIRPVQRLTEAVTRVTDTNELTPITVDGSGELADLGRSFNTMLGTLASSRERQKRLIADAGHELRTPLTALRTNVELLVADDGSFGHGCAGPELPCPGVGIGVGGGLDGPGDGQPGAVCEGCGLAGLQGLGKGAAGVGQRLTGVEDRLGCLVVRPGWGGHV